jgi:hypothetical protein
MGKTGAAALVALLVGGLGTVGVARPAALDLSTIDGVYKRTFPNALTSGEKYTSENVLEIVRLDRSRAYVRAHVEGSNGHYCGIYGVAHVEGQTLVYSRPALVPKGSTCTLRIEPRGGRIEIEDGGSCFDSCGVRAMYSEAKLALSSRRPIRYMARLKASREYREALAERH